MKRVLIYLVITLMLVSDASACSIASIETPHITSLKLTDTDTEYLVDISDGHDTLGSIILDIANQKVKSIKGNVQGFENNYNQSLNDYESSLILDGTILLLEIKDSTGAFSFSTEINTTSAMIDVNNYKILVSKKLKIVYLIFPNDIYSQSNNSVSWEDVSSLFLIPLVNPENYTFTYSISSYYFWNDFTSLYDEYQIVQTYGQGADCVGTIYLKYSEDGFRHMFSSFAGQVSFAKLDEEKFITITHAWESDVDTVRVLNGFGDVESEFFITVDEIQAALNDVMSSEIQLSIFTFVVVISAILPLTMKKRIKRTK